MQVAGAYVTVVDRRRRAGGRGARRDHPVQPIRFGVANSADEVRERVRAILNGGADFIKVIATGAVLTRGTKPGVSEFTEEQIRAAVEQAAEYGTFVAAHAHGAEGIKRAMRAGVRSIEHGSLIDDEGIALMKQHGTWLVADIYNGDYTDSVGREQKWPADILRKNTETTEAQRAGFRKAVAAGRAGSRTAPTAGSIPHGMNAMQLPYMVKYGHDADAGDPERDDLRRAAHAVGGPGGLDRAGEVRRHHRGRGRRAGRSAAASRKVAFVMKGGTVYKGP